MPRARIAWSLGVALCALSCDWTWSAQPLVIVTEDDYDGTLALVQWGHGEPNAVLAAGLAAGDCIEGFERARWGDLYLWATAAPDQGNATSGLIVPQLGPRGASLRDACQRIVVAADLP